MKNVFHKRNLLLLVRTRVMGNIFL